MNTSHVAIAAVLGAAIGYYIGKRK